MNRRHRTFLSCLRATLALLALLAASAWCPALAGTGEHDLESWRQNISATRRLAESDVPQAFNEAQRLYGSFPVQGTPADRARIFNLRARTEIYLGLTEPAASDAENALAIARAHNDKVGLAEAYLNLVLVAINQGRMTAISEATTNAMAAVDGIDRPDLVGEAMLRMSMLYRRNGQIESSATMAMQTLDMAEANGNPTFLTYALHGMGIAMEQSGRYAEARVYFLRMLEQSRIAGMKLAEAYALMGLGATSNGMDQLQAAQKEFDEALVIFRAAGTPFNVAHVLYTQAVLMRKQGQHKEALSLLDEATAIYERNPNKIGLWWTLNTRSGDRLALGQLAAATADAERAYALAKDIGAPVYLTGSLWQLAAVAAARGDHQQAYTLGKEASEVQAKNEVRRTGEHLEKLADRYKTEAKQRRIDDLTRQTERATLEQRWLWTILVACALLLLVTTIFLLRQRRTNLLLAKLNNEAQLARRKLQATLDAIPDQLFVMDLEGNISDYHAPRLDLLNVPPDGLQDCNLTQILPPEAVAVCRAALEEADANGISSGKQYALALPTGVAWFELSVARKRRPDGQAPRFIVLARDITTRKQAEEALAAREREFRTLAENIPDHIIRYDAKGHKIYVNSTTLRLMGVDSSQLIGRTPEETPEEIRSMALDDLSRAMRHTLATGQPSEIEVTLRHATEGMQTHNVRFVAELDESGGIVGALMVGRDITAKKATEEALRAREREFRTLAENLPDHIIRYDREGRQTYFNNMMTRIFGIDMERYLGMTVRDAEAAGMPFHADEDYHTALRHTLTTGERTEVFVHPPGETHSVQFVAERDESGQIDGVLAVGRDITVQKATEEALRAREREFRTLAENLPDHIVRYDLHGRKTYFNTAMAKLFGPRPEQYLGMTSEEANAAGTPCPVDNAYVDALRHTLTTGERTEILVHPPGETHSLHFVAERDEHGNIAGVLAVGRDITRIVETERKLEELSEELRELAARRESAREEERRHIAREIHDELGQRLTALRLKVNVFKLQFGNGAPALRDAVAELLRMVDGTIRVARSVSTSLRPASLDMGIATALDYLAEEFTLNTGIQCELGPMPAVFSLDEEKSIVLFRIAQESLTNVARHAEASHARIALECKNGGYTLEIADNGKGFDTRLATKRKFGLLGMRERGLAVGGKTDIESAPGKGTRVRVFIPITDTGEIVQ